MKDTSNINIFTIGYGNRKIEDFIAILQEHNIKYLIDVRTSPYSKWNEAFSQEQLKAHLKSKGLIYVYMGETLGGRPSYPSCYDREGNVDYKAIQGTQFFFKGISRLKKIENQKLKVALMCSEINPVQCHRSKLIGDYLHAIEIPVGHIDQRNKVRSQHYIMNKVLKGLSKQDLFGNPTKS